MTRAIRVLVTGTGTGVGKSAVTAALARRLSQEGPCAAIKPFETGVRGVGPDESLLAQAAGPAPYPAALLYRLDLPVAPAAAAYENRPLPPSVHQVASALQAIEGNLVVEGAGGLLVPIDRQHTFADLASLADLPMILVTYNGLGTLSHTLCAVSVAQARGLDLRAVLLNRGAPNATPDDVSQRTNLQVLQDHLDVPVLVVPPLSTELDQAATQLEELLPLLR